MAGLCVHGKVVTTCRECKAGRPKDRAQLRVQDMLDVVDRQSDWQTQQGVPYKATRRGESIHFTLADGSDWEIVDYGTLVLVVRAALKIEVDKDREPRPGDFQKLTRSASYILPIYRAAGQSASPEAA